ncbi:cadherin-like beta sandwich domain-containing protein [Brevibacillus brevis]|uniref:cadherin-like beta sandwich domain-containing protein n=1 Tax=Brevibacillus brevis TaxID=1393 RepID=UPI0037CAB35F
MVSFCKKVMMLVLGLMMAIGSLAGHALFAGSTAHAASTDNNWSQVSKAGIEGAQYATLLNANETLYIAYADSNQGGKTTVKKYNGTDWESVGDEGFSESQIRYPSLAVSNGEPYVAYIHNESVVVKKYEGGSWKTVGTEINASNEVLPSLISISGKIYLSYANKVNGGLVGVKATVKELQGNDWKVILNNYNSGKAIANIALANQNGKLHVAHVWPNSIQVFSLNGTDGYNPLWNFEEDYSISSHTPIAFAASDDSDSTYMAIVDQNDKSIVVYRDTPGKKSSSLSGPGTSEKDQGTHALSMAVKDDIPYVAYIDSNSGKATVKKYIGQWETVGNEAFTTTEANAVSLTIVGGFPYVVATDSSGDSTVYKMVSIPPPVLSTTATSSDVANAIDITYRDDPTWRQNITAVKDETNKQLAYTAAPGKITIQANELTAVGHTITVSATGYVDTSVKIVSNNADLSSISLNSGPLNETFNSEKTDYTQNVGQSVTNVSVTPTTADSKSTITVNGHLVRSGDASPAITLNAGSNRITIVVTAENDRHHRHHHLTIQ